MKKLNFILLFVLVAGASFLLNNQKSLAVTASDWKPGRIIDDVVFQNKQSMTVQQIQQFLDSKVPTCDRWGTLPMWSGGPTRAQWSADNGRDLAPYTCLKEYVENPTTKANNAHDPTVAVPGGLSAAQLIYNASQAQNINPQVYLVLLQKEQSLVTDDWPYAKQFERATGNNCPDTAPCNPAYAWLFTQVNNAGAQFNYYVTHFNQYNYSPGWNNILYNPNTACGRQSVFIENAFTAALYIYTPYVPNQAALNNMYGTGDSCSAYGNRNFWRLFSDWFGSAVVPSRYQGVSAINPPPTMYPGQTATAQIVIKNTSGFTWYSDGNVPIGQAPVRLMTPGYRQSAYSTGGPEWLGTKNQIRMVEVSVAPGQNATFNIPLIAPWANISETLRLFPVLDGVGSFPDVGMEFNIATNASVATYQGVSAINPPPTMYPGQTATAQIVIKNTSGFTWYSDGNVPAGNRAVRLMTAGYVPTPMAKASPEWLGTKNQIRMVEVSVAPGQNATFNIPLIAPYGVSNTKIRLLPVIDGFASMRDLGMEFNIATLTPDFSYEGVSAINPLPTMPAGSTAPAQLKIRNIGNSAWYNESFRPMGNYGSMRLVMSNPLYRITPFYDSADSSWLSANQIKMVEDVVLPGQVATFDFSFKAPVSTGTYFEHFVPVVDGVTALKDVGMGFGVRVY